MRRLRVMCAVMLALSSALAFAQPPPQTPTFRAGTNLVQVDAIVTDRSDQPVTDLTATDFAVTDDGVIVPITAFRFISSSSGEKWHDDAIAPIRNVDDEQREASRPGVRVFAILLDEYHVSRFNGLRIVPALVEFVRRLPPADLVAVYYPLDSVLDVRFTRDREAVIRRIQAFEGRQGIYYPPKYPVEEAHLRRLVNIERIRMQVSTTALEAIVAHVGGLTDLRKSVIIVSESLGSSSSDLTRLGQLAGGATFTGDFVQLANTQNVSMYPLDPSGLTGPDEAPGRRRPVRDLFKVLAAETGGLAIVNRNNFSDALAEVGRDASAYYLLGYVSPHPSDGKQHKIGVRVARSGLKVRARAGYLAFKPAEVTTEPTHQPVAPEVQSALDVLADALRPDSDESIRGGAAPAASLGPISQGLLGIPTIAVVQGRSGGVPVRRREFFRTERLIVQAPVLGDPVMSARLLSRFGQPLSDLAVRTAAAECAVTLSLGTLGPGDYVVELRAQVGDDVVLRHVAFRVSAR